MKWYGNGPLYLFFASVIAVLLLILIKTSNKMPTVTPDVKHDKGAVAAVSEICCETGKDMLKCNGSAVDAAIAALLCASVVNPHSMGIGGGVVFTIYNASTGKVETIDARETAPMSASRNMFDNESQKTNPGLLIAVPGELRGYELAHKRHRRLKWKELFEPSIKLAFDGFKLDNALAKAIQKNENMILKSETDVFCQPNCTTLKENDTIRFPQLAATYCRIAEEFLHYLPMKFCLNLCFKGGIITHQDLKDYKPALNESALNFTILNDYGMSSSNVSTDGKKKLTYHRMIETFRLASYDESKLREQHPDNVNAFVQNMISDDYAAFIRRQMKDDTTKQLSNKEERILCEDFGTSHLSVIAGDGSAVAVTSSINNHFGSKVMSRSTGIIFNDQMCDFRYARLIKPGTKPPSSMSPTIILDEDKPKNELVKMVVGASGGRYITSATAQVTKHNSTDISMAQLLHNKLKVILNYLFFGYNLQKAVQEPRVHSHYFLKYETTTASRWQQVTVLMSELNP
uniref:Si:ch73-59p9.2 n=1 Tax=Sinocyclocheilus rhinocerous TaxID=307959 RepID=A0A673H9C0_9TELE